MQEGGRSGRGEGATSRQRRRRRAGGFDEDVHSDGEIYQVGQAVSWPGARRRLVRGHKLMVAAIGAAGSSVAGSAGSSALVPCKRAASSTGATGGAVKKRPASVLSRVNNASGKKMVKTARIDPNAYNFPRDHQT